MKSDVKNHLIAGLSYFLSAQPAGSCRFAVAESYLAIDNYFSAILLYEGIKPPHNHKEKLNLIHNRFKNIFDKAGVNQKDIDNFHDWWLKVRYSSAIPGPNETIKFLRISDRIMSIIIEEIANRCGLTAESLENEVYADVLGKRWLRFDEECDLIHEKWQSEAEYLGEMGYGSKLGNKMLNPSNFCNIQVFTDDPITKEIIANDPNFSSNIGKFYDSFLKLVVYVQNMRIQRKIEADQIPNFTLSLRVSYIGQSMKEIGEEWGNFIVQALNDFRKQKR
jgi:hypothetical protein